MEDYIVWFIAAFVLLAAEMLTGTFYLLVIAIAAACGGIAAFAGAGTTIQFVVAAVLGFVFTVALRQWKARIMHVPEQSLDVGQSVRVEKWNDDGSARVSYRGTLWDAALENASTPRDATLYITSTQGSTLILSDRKP